MDSKTDTIWKDEHSKDTCPFQHEIHSTKNDLQNLELRIVWVEEKIAHSLQKQELYNQHGAEQNEEIITQLSHINQNIEKLTEHTIQNKENIAVMKTYGRATWKTIGVVGTVVVALGSGVAFVISQWDKILILFH